ncbi:MAG: DNA translocase FtsK 4TM domain-containing protein [Alistipes sp.]|nr:DNA translocase FtsK 4TM domain-containing protein [Alistipes sp.]
MSKNRRKSDENLSQTEVRRVKDGGGKSPRSGKKQIPEERSNGDTALWILGLLVAACGVVLLVAVISYFFNWRADYDVLFGQDIVEPQKSIQVGNVCGKFGVYVGTYFVTHAFGLFGVLLPVVLVLLGLHMIIRQFRYLAHTLLSLLLVTIFGSLTLGLLFEGRWDMFCSGWGGAIGIEVATLLSKNIGPFGAWIVTIVGWILTGIFINRNFIALLNRTGRGVVDKSRDLTDKMVHTLQNKMARPQSDDEPSEAEGVVAQSPDAEPEAVPTDVAPEEPEEGEEPAEGEVPWFDEEPAHEEPVHGVSAYEVPTEEIPPFAVGAEEVADKELPKSQIDVIDVIEHTEKEVSDRKADNRPFDPDHTRGYKHPSVEMLVDYTSNSVVTDDEIRENKDLIEETLGNFGIPIRDMKATIGPTVTLYEIVQEAGVKISRIQSLAPDIAQALKARGIRIIAPMPERGTIGIEVPNRNKDVVSMRSAVLSERFQSFKGELPVVIGRNIQNENVVFDLAKMPHLLVAGATGMGKSVGLNAILTSLLYRKDPSQLKLVLIDPKMVEFSPYGKLERHFLAKMASEDKAIVTDPKKAVYTLNSLCVEMEQRLVKCSDANVRNIKEYNELVRKREVDDTEIMPYIVVVIDEFADLIMIAKDVEMPVMRLAQKARAVGIHLIVATQRPSVDVITGRIKANFPARIAFRVMQMIDSRTIIDQPGADKLIGRGDMLLSKDGELTRIQCALVEGDEVTDIVNFIATQPSPTGMAYALPDYDESGGSESGGDIGSEESSAPVKYDKLFGEIARDAVSSGQISTSSIQRNYTVGFNRAGRIMMQLERAGIVGPQIGAKPREIKFYDLPSLEAKLQELGVS